MIWVTKMDKWLFTFHYPIYELNRSVQMVLMKRKNKTYNPNSNDVLISEVLKKRVIWTVNDTENTQKTARKQR